MAITINGSGTITGISAGGLPDGSVTAADLADTYLTPTGDGSSLTGIAGGVTDADYWSMGTSFSGNAFPVASNWSRYPGNNGWGTVVGTGMTESSGVFTFPSTGLWQVTMIVSSRSYANPTEYANFQIKFTPNGGTNWYTNAPSENATGNQPSGVSSQVGSMALGIMRISSTSDNKVRFDATQTSGNLCDSLYVTFVRLGDL